MDVIRVCNRPSVLKRPSYIFRWTGFDLKLNKNISLHRRFQSGEKVKEDIFKKKKEKKKAIKFFVQKTIR